jgi:hypothetical protein
MQQYLKDVIIFQMNLSDLVANLSRLGTRWCKSCGFLFHVRTILETGKKVVGNFLSKCPELFFLWRTDHE